MKNNQCFVVTGQSPSSSSEMSSSDIRLPEAELVRVLEDQPHAKKLLIGAFKKKQEK